MSIVRPEKQQHVVVLRTYLLSRLTALPFRASNSLQNLEFFLASGPVIRKETRFVSFFKIIKPRRKSPIRNLPILTDFSPLCGGGSVEGNRPLPASDSTFPHHRNIIVRALDFPVIYFCARVNIIRLTFMNSGKIVVYRSNREKSIIMYFVV